MTRPPQRDEPSRPAAGARSASQGASGPKANEESGQRDHNKRIADWTRGLFFITAALVGVGALQFGTSLFQWRAMKDQLAEMRSSSTDTHNLVAATEQLKDAGRDQAWAAKAQARAMDKLKSAGEAQAKAAEALAGAGRAQAQSTQDLVRGSGKQLTAIQASAEAARVQADAVQKQAVATIAASHSTDQLAIAGRAQADATRDSLGAANTANQIALGASIAADRPWVGPLLPGSGPPDVNKDYLAEFNVANTGHSPALSVTVNIAFDIYPVANTILPALAPCLGTCQVYTIWPGAALTFHPSLAASKFSADEIQRLTDQQDAMVLRTRFDYHDAGGRAYTSITCSLYKPKIGFTACSGGNGAD